MKMEGYTRKWKHKVSTEREKIKSSLEVVATPPTYLEYPAETCSKSRNRDRVTRCQTLSSRGIGSNRTLQGTSFFFSSS